MNKIISAFPGIGKTTLVQTNKNYIDLESSDYKWLDIDKGLSIEERKGTAKTINPDFPANYIKKICELTSMGFNVLISSHKEVREALQAQGIKYTIVLPSLNMKEEMIMESQSLTGKNISLESQETKRTPQSSRMLLEKYLVLLPL